MFGSAFLFLLGAAAAVAMAQFNLSRIGPWLSIGYSAAAVLCAIVATVMRPQS